jgi:uncharacterized protein YfiM (DUF2279 family)
MFWRACVAIFVLIFLLLRNACYCSDTQQQVYMNVDLWFSGDKVLHFGISLCVGFSIYSVYFVATRNDMGAKCISITSAVLLGLIKEYYDWRVKKHFSYKDLAWDAIGASMGALLGEMSCKNNVIFVEKGR